VSSIESYKSRDAVVDESCDNHTVQINKYFLSDSNMIFSTSEEIIHVVTSQQ